MSLPDGYVRHGRRGEKKKGEKKSLWTAAAALFDQPT